MGSRFEGATRYRRIVLLGWLSLTYEKLDNVTKSTPKKERQIAPFQAWIGDRVDLSSVALLGSVDRDGGHSGFSGING